MADENTQETTTPEGEENTEVTEEENGTDPEGAEALGDPGKKALDAMKAERNSYKQQLKELRKELEELKAPKAKDGEEPDADAIKAAAQKEADARANARIVKAEIKAAAAGKLADPADALRYLDADLFEVDADGNVDSEEIAEAIADLLVKKPYLATATGNRFQGSADQGARPRGPAQLTREDLKKMSPEQIVKAKAEGRLNKLYGVS